MTPAIVPVVAVSQHAGVPQIVGEVFQKHIAVVTLEGPCRLLWRTGQLVGNILWVFTDMNDSSSPNGRRMSSGIGRTASEDQQDIPESLQPRI